MGKQGQDENIIGETVYRHRKALKVSQEVLADRYDVSGPAIFKIEQGRLKPSLELWMRMAKDFGISKNEAVLIWIRSRLPAEYRGYLQPRGKKYKVAEKPYVEPKAKKFDYSNIKARRTLRRLVLADAKIPKPIKDLVKDDDIWKVYKPAGKEINFLRDFFAPLGKGSKEAYVEALRVIRSFHK